MRAQQICAVGAEAQAAGCSGERNAIVAIY